MKYCSNCGKEINSDAEFCINCGKMLNPTQNKIKRKVKINIWIKIVIAACSVMTILIIIAFVDNVNKSNNLMESENNLLNSEQPKESETKKNTKSKEEIIQSYKNNCQEYSYENIFRYAEDYDGKYAKFTGEVVQIMDAAYLSLESYVLRVNITKDEYGYYEDTIYVTYLPMEESTRILEDDIVTIYGILDGLETYKTIFGGTETIPSINSNYIEIIN